MVTSAQRKRSDATREQKPRAALRSSRERWVVGALLLCGALPLIGYLAIDAGYGRELGVATVVLAFTLHALFRRPTGGRAPAEARSAAMRPRRE